MLPTADSADEIWRNQNIVYVPTRRHLRRPFPHYPTTSSVPQSIPTSTTPPLPQLLFLMATPNTVSHSLIKRLPLSITINHPIRENKINRRWLELFWDMIWREFVESVWTERGAGKVRVFVISMCVDQASFLLDLSIEIFISGCLKSWCFNTKYLGLNQSDWF